jgi:tRNA threonylcarbamoyladenosine biosynthesis protein TsaB
MILALKTVDFTTELRLLSAEGQTIQSATWDSGRRLADQLLDKIQQLLSAGHAGGSDLNGIIIFSGPGSFTSLRIGHSVANALADSYDIAVVGADGDDWLKQGSKALSKAQSGRPALPEYGAEAHITKPKA